MGSALAPGVGNHRGADVNARVTLYEGASILFPEGPRIVVAVGPFGYTVRDVTGGTHEVSWTDVQPARAIVDGRVDAVAESLMAVLSGLSDDALQESQDKQEVVLTMRTGFARGHPALARPGEPYSLFWVNAAGGHPNASPARTTAARARRFASSLTSAQVRTLSAAVPMPTNRYEEDHT